MSDDVFILGAGFSKAISEQMPTLAELSEALWPKVAKLFPEGNKPPEEMASNIEALLSYLAQDYPWLPESQNLKNHAAFLDLADIIAKEFIGRQKKIEDSDIPEWLIPLIIYWHNNKINVITFNYDTLIEKTTVKLKDNSGNSLKIEDLYSIQVTPGSSLRGTGVVASIINETFFLHKMHGSINWCYSGSREFYGEPIYITGIDGTRLKTLAAKVPLVVPPTLEKSVFFKNEGIRQIWRSAGKALSEARKIFCLGYSFPITDMMVQFFTLTNQPDSEVEFYWVNRANPHRDLKTMLPESYTINDKYVREDAISAFTNDYISGNL